MDVDMSSVHFIKYYNYPDCIMGDLLYRYEYQQIDSLIETPIKLANFLNLLIQRYTTGYKVVMTIYEKYKTLVDKDKYDANGFINLTYSKLISLPTPIEFTKGVMKMGYAEGDLIDLEDYEGIGYYYIYGYEMNLYIEKTTGSDGTLLPIYALKMILMFDKSFFNATRCNKVQVSDEEMEYDGSRWVEKDGLLHLE